MSVRRNRRGESPVCPGGRADLVAWGVAEACFYADRAVERPSCERLAVVVYSDRPWRVALCGDCDRRRSAVGKGMSRRRLADPAALVSLMAARDGVLAAEEALDEASRQARAAGQSWSAIAVVLGMSKQAAQQRFDPR